MLSSLTVVLPAYNEAPNIAATVDDVLSWLDKSGVDGEVIVVDDGSGDGMGAAVQTVAERDTRVRLIVHERNRGYGAAIHTGCDAATREWIVFMDSDGQFHADDIGTLAKGADTYGFISGVRRRRADPFNRKLNAFLYGTLIRLVLGVHVRDLNCGLKMFKKDVWQKVRPKHATGALFNAEVFLRLKKNGIPWGDIPVEHYPRAKGQQTGAKASVIVRMFTELWALRRSFAAEQG